MGEPSRNSVLLTRYLLGDLPTAEQERLEEEYFSDNDLFIELLDVKDQLTSDYLAGRLALADRERFERKFLAQPDCRQDVELDQFLQPALARNSLPRQSAPQEKMPTWWQTIFITLHANRPLAGAALVALLITSAIGLRSALQPSPKTSPASLAQASPTAFDGPITVSLSLKSGRQRTVGVVTPTAAVGANTQTIELQLEVNGENYARYQAILLRTDETTSTEVLTDSALKAEAAANRPQTVTWKLPAAKLSIGDYQVKLSGMKADNSTGQTASYDFKVRNQ